MSNPVVHRRSLRVIAPSAPSRSEERISSRIAATCLTVGQWFARSRQRRALREIAERNDIHLLKDIGLSQEEALREADKPFWRR
jgi:uncharacterized protein YjiS (DUF1127 family)